MIAGTYMQAPIPLTADASDIEYYLEEMSTIGDVLVEFKDITEACPYNVSHTV